MSTNSPHDDRPDQRADARGAAAMPEDALAYPDAPPEAEAPAAAAQRIAELEAQVAQLKDQALRALAEAENTRRRASREIEDNTRYAAANFARELLTVADNLRRALDSTTAEARQADERLASFYAGVELTERELLAVFERIGIRRIDPLGQPFDHNRHQAVYQVETADHAPGTVVQTLQPGYVMHDRLLRPALVAVAKPKSNAAAASGANVDTTA